MLRDVVDPAVWRRPDMMRALAARDVATVFRLLQRMGVSQRRIAAMTGQSQSEISEITSGRRVVSSVEVLERIADGLSVPRGLMGLAHDQGVAELAPVAPPPMPSMDLVSGRWVVPVPIYVDSYAAAVSLCESASGSLSTAALSPTGTGNEPNVAARAWLTTAGRVLAGHTP